MNVLGQWQLSHRTVALPCAQPIGIGPISGDRKAAVKKGTHVLMLGVLACSKERGGGCRRWMAPVGAAAGSGGGDGQARRGQEEGQGHSVDGEREARGNVRAQKPNGRSVVALLVALQMMAAAPCRWLLYSLCCCWSSSSWCCYSSLTL